MNPNNQDSGVKPAAPSSAAPKADMQQAAEGQSSALPAAQALRMLMQDPVGFVQEIVSKTTEKALADLKEQAELRGALNTFRKAYPEFKRFEPFILQEVAMLIENDQDGAIDPWEKLLEKGMQSFTRKFQERMKEEASGAENPVEPPAMEGAANRVSSEQPPVFSRDQIAKMSLGEFLKNEAAINDALKSNRIK